MASTLSESQDVEQATVDIARPDAKTRRYDRQLRLWAASGQSLLESASIIAVPATATTAQALKNLVLPGIGSFTLLDPEKVNPADAGNNFFLEHSSIGKGRASEVARLLSELNDGVKYGADERGLEKAMSEVESWPLQYQLVIAHNAPHSTLERLAKRLWDAGPASPPLVVIRSAGLIAEFYIQQHEHTGE